MTRSVRRAVIVCIAAGVTGWMGCRSEPASVEELYSTRMVGLSHLQRNQLAEAESAFKKLTRLAPDDPAGHADLGLTYLQMGRHEEAIAELQTAIELSRNRALIVAVLGHAYAKAGLKHYWILDPKAKTVRVLQLDDESYVDIALVELGQTWTAREPFEVSIEPEKLFLQ